MKNSFAKLLVVTVHKGPIKDLIKTLKSIDAQIIQPKHSLVIASNIFLHEIKKYKKKSRTFILNKDKSIYSAMNIALKHNTIKNISVIFLNSGDLFYDRRSVYNIDKYLKLNRPIVGMQVLHWSNNYFHTRKSYFIQPNYLPHGAFICTERIFGRFSRKNLFFDEKHIIDADGLWMKNIVKLSDSGVVKIRKNISVHELGGVSTTPSLSSINHYRKISFFAFMKELSKFILKLLIINKSIYYRIIYSLKYRLRKLK